MRHNAIGLDTNVLIYLHDGSSPDKRAIAKNLLANNPHIPSQVISEYLNVSRRLLGLSKDELLINSSGLFSGCIITPTLPHTLLFAASLVKKHQFQLFDAIIVATAIEAHCNILYSEDMHHKLVVNKSLTHYQSFFIVSIKLTQKQRYYPKN